MQHWHVFCKWNEKLYHEMHSAYLSGRSNKDPSVDWYESEIGFFDHYVIPLARKLKECGVFGVPSDEYLQYALANRQEWASKGEQVTKEMIARRIQNYGDEKPERITPETASPVQRRASPRSCNNECTDAQTVVCHRPHSCNPDLLPAKYLTPYSFPFPMYILFEWILRTLSTLPLLLTSLLNTWVE